MDNLVKQYKEKINDLMNINQTLLDKIEQNWTIGKWIKIKF